MPEVTQRQIADEMSRVIGTVAAANYYKVPLENFPPYTGWVICVLSGRGEDILRMCREFTKVMQPKLEAAQAAQEKRA